MFVNMSQQDRQACKQIMNVYYPTGCHYIQHCLTGALPLGVLPDTQDETLLLTTRQAAQPQPNRLDGPPATLNATGLLAVL